MKQAEQAVQRYVRDIVSVAQLTEQLERARQADSSGEAPTEEEAWKLAYSLCGQALYEACQLAEGHLRNLAFRRLNEHLENKLRNMLSKQHNPERELWKEDILQQTMEEIIVNLQCERRKPRQPAAFLRWAGTILQYQCAAYLRKQQRRSAQASLEDEDESYLKEVSSKETQDPLETVVQHEVEAEMHTAVASLRNARYSIVLDMIYFKGLEMGEVATHLQVSVADIYLWHCRALQMLYKQMTGYRATRRTLPARKRA